jgi:hypothetical protein
MVHEMRPIIGVLRCDPAVCTHGNSDLTGKDADGTYRTKSKEMFKTLLCERLALCLPQSVYSRHMAYIQNLPTDA